jgi:hypothetical protein
MTSSPGSISAIVGKKRFGFPPRLTTTSSKRMLPYFSLGHVKHHPEILEMIHSIPDWMALPELGTPINRNILEKAIYSGNAPLFK